MSNDKFPAYAKRFIAFVDILGFRDLIRESEKHASRIAEIADALTAIADAGDKIKQDSRELGFFAFSDSIVITSKEDAASFGALLYRLQLLYLRLIRVGILCRGAVECGNLIHENAYVFGPALIDAYSKEQALAVHPRLLLSTRVLEKMDEYGKDEKWKKRFNGSVFRDGDGCIFFDPLTRLDGYFWEEDAQKIQYGSRQCAQIRKQIVIGLQRSIESPRIFEKYEWLAQRFNLIVEKNKKHCAELEHVEVFPVQLSNIDLQVPDGITMQRKIRVNPPKLLLKKARK